MPNWLRRRRFAVRKFPSLVVHPRSGIYSLDFHAEQAPNPQSRVSVVRERDRLGVPKIHVDWRMGATDLRTVRLSLAALAEEFAASGCAVLRYDSSEILDAVQRDGAYGGHHLGTARMSESPATGVVDTQCKLHDIENLYIASGAVFPTSGQDNPTLPIIALALRLADHLAQRLAQR